MPELGIIVLEWARNGSVEAATLEKHTVAKDLEEAPFSGGSSDYSFVGLGLDLDVWTLFLS